MEPKVKLDLGFPIHFMGHLHDDVSLRLLYSAADSVVIPSRQDNLPNVGVEAHACATPVVAFDVGGLPDIVEHGKTGYLAKAFDTTDMAAGLKWVLEDEIRHLDLRAAARRRAERLWSYEAVAPQYMAVYAEAIKQQG
jgi:glycosyltransferase involved in cell wall biosynthesis